MNLSERLRQLEPAAAPEGLGQSRTAGLPVVVADRADPRQVLTDRLQAALFERLGTRLHDPDRTDEELQELVSSELAALVDAERVPLTADEQEHLVASVVDDVLRLGPIEPLLEDPAVTEVMVSGTTPIWVERAGRLHRTDARFTDERHLRRVIERVVGAVGRRIDESSPMVDARLADGSRINAVLPPLAVDGPSLTIRKFARDRWSADDLVRFGTLTPPVVSFLARCVEGKLNVLVSGGTGTGKTTLLNVLSSFIPEDERIVTIEDAVELRFQQAHVIRLESRPPNLEGHGAIEIRDLVRNALRMRPDRIVVGEVRGAEALDMLQAMNTGHDGSMSTVHANTARDALSRLETMVLMAGVDLPVRAIRDQIASSIDLVVQVGRLRDGTRRVVQVTEVVGMEGEVVTLQDVFVHRAGELAPTGIRPLLTDRLLGRNIHVPAELFLPAGGLR